mgnify:CR=1 FL=1|jgi:hypothetical protein
MYQIRKVESFTVLQHTTTANLDPEKFRQFGYEGDSEQEFLDFITELEFDEIYEELDEETRNELGSIKSDYEWTEYYNSAWDGENSWYEIGEENPEWRRTGGFEVRFSNE